MNRPYYYRREKVAGVFQRCNRDCPPDKCTDHRWAFHIELPAGPDGRRRQISRGGFATGRDAMKAREKVSADEQDGKLGHGPAATFADWADEWLAGKVERGELRPSSHKAHENALAHLKRQLGRRKLRELTGYDLTKAYMTIIRDRQAEIEKALKNGGKAPRPISPASIVRIHSVANNCLRSAVEAKLIPYNIAADAKKPKHRERRVNPWNPAQARQFLGFLTGSGHRLAPLFHLAIHTGLRRGELLGLGWADVDLDAGTLEVRRQRVTVAGKVSVVDQPKTEAGERLVPLFPGTVAVLRQWRAQQKRERLQWGPAWNDGGWVFTHEDGQPLYPDTVGRTFRKLTDQAGLPRLRFHDLRHTFASIALDAEVPMPILSKVMGHSNSKITEGRYAHLSPEKHGEVMKVIGERLGSAAG
ncbi:MAG: site-specific integrase [Micromonospora sp.]